MRPLTTGPTGGGKRHEHTRRRAHSNQAGELVDGHRPEVHGGSAVTLDLDSEADAADLARALWGIARPTAEAGWYELAHTILRRWAALRAG